MATPDPLIEELSTRGEGALGELLARPPAAQRDAGYADTLREICQQPSTWRETAARASGAAERLRRLLAAAGVLDGRGALLLTGSGSSEYAGSCLAPALQERLAVPVAAVGSGALLTEPGALLPPRGPFALVSFGRSGNSPESRAVFEALQTQRAHHVVVTCNASGALASACEGAARCERLVLDEATCDRSLVMTSSFTNMVLAARVIGWLDDLQRHRESAARLAESASVLLRRDADALAARVRRGLDSAVFLGSGCRHGSAREAALKMLEMTGGEVWTIAESYLGLRHGPMAAIGDATLVVAFLSSAPVVRAYELDLLRELDAKGLGVGRVVVGARAAEAAGPRDVAVACPDGLGDDELTLLDAVVGQLLGLFSCLSFGLRPDAPSPEGAISRVVPDFRIHPRPPA